MKNRFNIYLGWTFAEAVELFLHRTLSQFLSLCRFERFDVKIVILGDFPAGGRSVGSELVRDGGERGPVLPLRAELVDELLHAGELEEDCVEELDEVPPLHPVSADGAADRQPAGGGRRRLGLGLLHRLRLGGGARLQQDRPVHVAVGLGQVAVVTENLREVLSLVSDLANGVKNTHQYLVEVSETSFISPAVRSSSI